jgi:hypothetical protein
MESQLAPPRGGGPQTPSEKITPCPGVTPRKIASAPPPLCATPLEPDMSCRTLGRFASGRDQIRPALATSTSTRESRATRTTLLLSEIPTTTVPRDPRGVAGLGGEPDRRVGWELVLPAESVEEVGGRDARPGGIESEVSDDAEPQPARPRAARTTHPERAHRRRALQPWRRPPTDLCCPRDTRHIEIATFLYLYRLLVASRDERA